MKDNFIENIKSLEFDVFRNIMTIHLIRPIVKGNVNTTSIQYNSTLEIFTEKLNKFNEYKNIK